MTTCKFGLRGLAGALLCGSLLAACSKSGGSKAQASDGGPDAASSDGPAEGWASFGGDLSHSRTSPMESELSTSTVGRLARKWSVDAPGVTSSPAIVDGVVYWTDWAGGVYATRALDGSEVWKRSLPFGFTSSPFVTNDRVYLSDRKGTVYALGRSDGTTLWATAIDPNPHSDLWSSPMIAGDVLVVGLGGNGTQQAGVPLPVDLLDTFRGAVVGLDARTGDPLWRFDTTRKDGTDYGAGVSVWSSAAIDEGLGIAFIGTGNSYFVPASPYSDSLLALRYETGELAWAHQFTAEDAFRSGAGGGPDFDVGAAPNLFSAGGRDLVGVGDKGGTYRALDRRTGELVWETPLTTGSALGGVIAPAAVAGGIVYVCSNQSGTQTKVFALDAATGREIWQHDVAPLTFGAPALANGVLFVGPASGELFALDATTGSQLWGSKLETNRGGGFAVSAGMVFTGGGFAYFNEASEPIAGALTAFGLGDGPGWAPPAILDAGRADAGPDGGATPGGRYENLSETGLFSDTAGGVIAPGVEAFEPRFALWSDGATKRRWIRLPAGSQIDTADLNAWSFPVGTKVWKEFTRDGVRVETRIIEKIGPDEWYFMPFQWSQDQSEALPVPGGVTDASGTLHDIPSQADCTVCHNGTPDRILGFSAIQLSHSGTDLTLGKLSAASRLTAPPPGDLVVPGDAVATAALGYLHANCGQCHNPTSGVFITLNLDVRLRSDALSTVETTPTYLSTVGVLPIAGGSGPTTARIEPGRPETSAVSYRMGQRPANGQMPPLASELVDAEGLAAMNAWITALAP